MSKKPKFELVDGDPRCGRGNCPLYSSSPNAEWCGGSRRSLHTYCGDDFCILGLRQQRDEARGINKQVSAWVGEMHMTVGGPCAEAEDSLLKILASAIEKEKG